MHICTWCVLPYWFRVHYCYAFLVHKQELKILADWAFLWIVPYACYSRCWGFSYTHVCLSMCFAARSHTMEERSNLVNMMKLSIKILIQSALSLGRTLDSDFPPLQQFFIVLEHCLKHGLKGEFASNLILCLYGCKHNIFLICSLYSYSLRIFEGHQAFFII